tara:strand:+ start:4483 stop:5010 length:528 start_codon:yes stop_codon:yes gene_type:complete
VKIIFAALVLCTVPLLLNGCGIFKGYKKNSEGYYEKHYNCCGPIALEKAINAFYIKEGIVFVENPAPKEELSKLMQDRGMKVKELLSYFHREAICITWSSEMKYVADKYGFELVSVNGLNELDPEEDIAIILVHGRHFSKEYHWLVFPVDDIKNYYGDKTVVDIVYLLKWKEDSK